MQNLKDIIKAYEKLQEVINTHQEAFSKDSIVQSIKGTIQRLNLEDRFGISLSDHGYCWYQNYNNLVNAYVGFYGKDYQRDISWSDDGRQPNEEWLYVLSFPTGPYIFGDYFKGEYPVKTFESFFEELKAFEPKYSDTHNNALYFTNEVSAKVHAALPVLFNKYKSLVQDEMKQLRKKELEDELAKLSKD